MEETVSEERGARDFAAGCAVTETYGGRKNATGVCIEAAEAAAAECGRERCSTLCHEINGLCLANS